MNGTTVGTAAAVTSAASHIGGRLCKIVLTGGPGGGKSTALTKLRNRLVHRGLPVTLIGENATPLIERMGGYELSWRHTWKHVEFQRVMLKAQLEQEDNIMSLCRLREDDRVIILDRGAFDGRTFCTADEWEQVRNSNHIYTDQELFDSYSYGVGSTNESRFHTPSMAAEADKLGREFVTHTGKNVYVVETKEDFDDKVEEVFRCVQQAISRLWGPAVVEGLSTKRVQHKVRVLRSWEEICQLPEVSCGSKEAAKVGDITELDRKSPEELMMEFPSLDEERLLPQGDSPDDRSKMESSEETVMTDSGEKGPKRMANLSVDAYERAIREYEMEKALHGEDEFPKQILKRQFSYETKYKDGKVGYITLKAYSGLDGTPCPGYENIWVLDMEDPAGHAASYDDVLSMMPSFVEPVPEAAAVVNSPSPSQRTSSTPPTVGHHPDSSYIRFRKDSQRVDGSPVGSLALQRAGISTAAGTPDNVGSSSSSSKRTSVTRKSRLPKSRLVLCHHPTADAAAAAAAAVPQAPGPRPVAYPSKRSRDQTGEAAAEEGPLKLTKPSATEEGKENSSSSNTSMLLEG
ncbi:hypothetical protein FOL46_004747 [Perkinsus olseni]|uniref:NadR/Ttd14 AAA domain-containing protein n=1 Tax=Perkinsus olseni TaxID=32597 RepID=A0A7J6MUA4_PEROL|nr:hypothetical protein FOL46_004747 [Perkinsus olseni]